MLLPTNCFYLPIIPPPAPTSSPPPLACYFFYPTLPPATPTQSSYLLLPAFPPCTNFSAYPHLVQPTYFFYLAPPTDLNTLLFPPTYSFCLSHFPSPPTLSTKLTQQLLLLIPSATLSPSLYPIYLPTLFYYSLFFPSRFFTYLPRIPLHNLSTLFTYSFLIATQPTYATPTSFYLPTQSPYPFYLLVPYRYPIFYLLCLTYSPYPISLPYSTTSLPTLSIQPSLPTRSFFLRYSSTPTTINPPNYSIPPLPPSLPTTPSRVFSPGYSCSPSSVLPILFFYRPSLLPPAISSICYLNLLTIFFHLQPLLLP